MVDAAALPPQSSSRKRKSSGEEDDDDDKIRDFFSSLSKTTAKKKASGDAQDAPPKPKPAPPLYFDVVREDATGVPELLGRLDLSGTAQLTFGRDPTRVDVALEHASVSRHHATLTFDGATAFVSDFRSTHGTFVARAGGEEKRLEAKELVQLSPGDSVRFGQSSRRYVFYASQEDAPAKKPEPPRDGVVDLGGGKIKLTLRAPAHVVERLLSPDGGATLKAIEQRTSTRLAFESHRGRRVDDAPAMRLVEIKGNPNSVAAARLELVALSQQPPSFADGRLSAQRFRYASTSIPSDSLLD